MAIDIETIGRDFDSLDGAFKESLLKRANTDEEVRQVKEGLALNHLTAEIVAIALVDTDLPAGAVYYQAPGELPMPFTEDGISFEAGTEGEILARFWDMIKLCGEFVTFNGRGFDCPFIMVRSAINRVRPTRDLMPNRYSGPHVDLFDRLTFFGATQRKFGLDLWCRAIGIKSPKEEGVSGVDVGAMFKAGKYAEIARYCARDARATAELYKVWAGYLNPGGPFC